MSGRRTVAVFGGTGFLGRRLVRHLAARDFAVRVVARHPERGGAIFGSNAAKLELVRADINDDEPVRAAVTGAFGVVNAVSLYIERGTQTFRSVHVDGAARLARHARELGVARLVHVSGVGADARSRSSYIRSRGLGEGAVRAAFPMATVVRPTVMFGPDDAFLTALIGLLRTLPVFPMFGKGRTALQPVDVEDVGEAIARAFDAPAEGSLYELGGPRVYSYQELLQTIADHLNIRPILVPMPLAAWHVLASLAEMLPQAPVTRNQVELMAIDNVVAPDRTGFEAFGMEPRSIEAALAADARAS
jgi:NADH dehydrogenase